MQVLQWVPLHLWANETSVWREEGGEARALCWAGTCLCISECVQSTEKRTITPEGERRKRNRTGKVLCTPVYKAPAAAVPVPSNKSLFRKKAKLSLEGEKEMF